MSISRKHLTGSIPTNSDVIVTSLGTISAKNPLRIDVTNGTGYFTIGNIIFQYGTYNTYGKTKTEMFTANYNFEVTFPKTFPTKCLIVLATVGEFSSAYTLGNGPQIVPTLEGWDNSKFRIMGDITESNYNKPSAFSWLAIGY